MIHRFFTDRHALFMLSLGILVLFTLGCASGPSQPAAPPSVDVTGYWHGMASGPAGSSFVTMSLRQTGADVTGDIAVNGFPQNSGSLQGTISGETFTYSAPGGAGAEMTVRASEMFGMSRFGSRLYLKR